MKKEEIDHRCDSFITAKYDGWLRDGKALDEGVLCTLEYIHSELEKLDYYIRESGRMGESESKAMMEKRYEYTAASRAFSSILGVLRYNCLR